MGLLDLRMEADSGGTPAACRAARLMGERLLIVFLGGLSHPYRINPCIAMIASVDYRHTVHVLVKNH